MKKFLKIMSFILASVRSCFVSDSTVAAKVISGIRTTLRLMKADTVVLVFAHRWGGGIERYLRDKAKAASQEGCLFVFLRPSINFSDKVEIDLFKSQSPQKFENVNWLILKDIFAEFNVVCLEIHSLMGWPFSALARIEDFAFELRIAYAYYVHDFMSICPQIHLVDHTSWYCKENGVDFCRICMSKKDNPRKKAHLPPYPHGKQIDILEWRIAYKKLLSNASKIVAPSMDAARRLERYYPGVCVTIVPHYEKIASVPSGVVAKYCKNENLRVAIIGAIRGVKGSKVLLDCAVNALQLGLPIEFIVVGTTNMRSNFDRLGNVHITGKYIDENVYEILRKQNCHIAFFPSVCPETFSYTLSIGINAGFHCFVFDIGAQAERLRGCGKGTIIPMNVITSPYEINKLFLEYFGI